MIFIPESNVAQSDPRVISIVEEVWNCCNESVPIMMWGLE